MKSDRWWRRVGGKRRARRTSRRPAVRPTLGTGWEALESRRLLACVGGSGGTLCGTLWNDADANGVQDSGESPLAGWVAYLDTNDNRQFDAGEPSAVADANGDYAFEGQAAGSYRVGAVGRTGWEQTFPTSVPATELRIELEDAASTFSGALAARHAGDGSERLFVVERSGLIRIAHDGQILPVPFLDLSAKLESSGAAETGLLGLAFHPEFAQSGAFGEGRFYVYYSAPSLLGGHHDSVVSEYRVSPTDPNRADPSSERVLLRFAQPFSNHNGGDLQFGPDDGLLYIASGDGGSGGDPLGNAQNLGNLLGAILRIDVQGTNSPNGQYGIPSSNPFVGQPGVREEIFAYGFRNPFRMSFDNVPGGDPRLFVGDVGQNHWEEVDLVVAGGNYGWNYLEGTHGFSGSPPPGVTLIPPIAEYPNASVGISVIGGYVYRGQRFPEMQGVYIFADFNGRLMALEEQPGGTWTRSDLQVAGGNPTGEFIRSLGEDESGELYVVTSTRLRSIRSVTPAARHAVSLSEGETRDNLDFGLHAAGGTAEIRGVVWEDGDASGSRETGETGLAGWTVYLDQNANQRRDADEPFTRSLADGSYHLLVPAPGEYRVALEPQAIADRTVSVTAPASEVHTELVAVGDLRAARDFGVNIAIPVVQILDNGDTGFTTTGSWTRWTGQGFQGDVHESLAGDGSGVARWTFASVTPGIYRVSATWTTYSNRATNSPFAVKEGGTTRATANVNQRLPPGDLNASGVPWEDLATGLAVAGGPLVVELANHANGNLNADAIRIERLGDLPSGPEIQVLDGVAGLADGGGPVDFGTTPPGTPVTRTFTIQNVGTEVLTLSAPLQLPDGFRSNYAATSLPAGQSTTFTVTLDAAADGTFEGVLSFPTNDPDENPFDFALRGVVATPPPPPVIRIIDNGTAGFATVGSWTPWGGQGYEGDVHESLAGSGADVASWTFDGLSPGVYRVSATWTAYSNRATNSPYTVLDGNSPLGTVAVNQRVLPDDFADAGVNWEDLGGNFTIAGSQLVVRLSDLANGNLNADAIRIERVGDLASGPEIQVLEGTTEIAAGGGPIDFGSTPPGTPLTRTFTIRNAGNEPLVLTDPLQLPNGFAADFGATTLQAGQSSSFQITLQAASLGTFSGTVSLGSNDSDENPFDFAVTGVVATAPPPPVVRILDNGDAGFTLVGSWTRWTGQGFQSDVHESLAGSGADVAQWAFDDINPGMYRVSATWSTYSNRATNSPFTVLDGSRPLATVAVNQRVLPDDFQDAGAAWEDLGRDFRVTGTRLVVHLSDQANGNLNADAIRIERVGDLAEGPEIQVLADTVDLVDGSGQVSFGTTSPGSPLSRMFTVRNLGTQDLVLSEPLQTPAGYSTNFTATTLAAGQSTTFTITLDAAAEGTFQGEVALSSNDADESPFQFHITGSVASGPPPADVLILDDGDTGFSTLGSWGRWTGQGFQGDVREALPGDGSATAHWTFDNLRPGRYHVAVTWTDWINRASNSPFSVLDGTHVLATVPVNQRVAPNDYQDAGVSWQGLGNHFTIGGSTLVVRLSNQADGRLNADAVRIEYLGPAFAGGGEGEGPADSPLPAEALFVVDRQHARNWFGPSNQPGTLPSIGPSERAPLDVRPEDMAARPPFDLGRYSRTPTFPGSPFPAACPSLPPAPPRSGPGRSLESLPPTGILPLSDREPLVPRDPREAVFASWKWGIAEWPAGDGPPGMEQDEHGQRLPDDLGTTRAMFDRPRLVRR